MLQPIAENVWVVRHYLRLFGIMPVVTRMIVVRLADKKLWLWAPIPLSAALIDELKALGEVTYVVAPNSFHHLFLKPCREHFPKAHYMGVPNLQRKKPDFKFDAFLNKQNFAPWQAEISHKLFDASRLYQEGLFYHHASKSLIVTDLVMNIPRSHSSLANLACFCYGILDKPASSPICRLLTRHRNQCRQTIHEVENWPFERLVTAHGEIIGENAKATLHRALQWLN